MTMPQADRVGCYARSIESGWIGKIVACDGELYRMHGVDVWWFQILGGHVTDYVDETDTQWFAHDDLRFLKVVTP